MPGLVGLISKLPRKKCDERLKSMLRAIRHESSYRYGLYAETEMFTYIGWTSHRSSFSDCMPIRNENSDIVMFLAGEVFSDSDKILDLRRKGHEFTEGDASYLIHLYEDMGHDFFKELNGWFSGVLIDKRQRKTILFNDRYGMYRVFRNHGKDGFFFSSEAKAILAILPETRELDPKGLSEFMTCGCTLGERSLFKNIEVLPGGSLLEFNKGALQRKGFYFDRMVWEGKARLSENDFKLCFTDMFPRIVNKYFLSQRPVAMSLTGGLDTRMVLGCLDLPPGSLPCYTFGSMYRDTFDVKVARQVARQCGQEHEVIVVGNEFLAELTSYLEKAVFLSDGYMGLSGAVELYANSLAREIAPVRLTGNWGGELLRGVRAFKLTVPRGGILHPELYGFVEEARATFEEISSMRSALSFAAFQQAPQQGYGRLSIERSQLDLRTPFFDNELIELLYQSPDKSDGFALSESIIALFRPDLYAIPTDRGYLGTGGFLARGFRVIWRKALFKAEYYASHGAPNWLVGGTQLINWLHLEDKLIGKHKFYHLRLWLREQLESYVRDVLTNNSQLDVCPCINKKALEGVLNDHFQERKNYIDEIDKVLTIALTHKLLLNSSNMNEMTTDL